MEGYETGGVFRITCPDASLLYDVTKMYPLYWWWRKGFFENTEIDPEPIDYFMSEVGTENIRQIGKFQIHNDYAEKFVKLSKKEFLSYVVEGLSYDLETNSSHINFWTYEKIEEFLRKSGFNNIIRSTCHGSCYPEMQDQRYFDLPMRTMNLYADAIKG